jgi:hypothetical protein
MQWCNSKQNIKSYGAKVKKKGYNAIVEKVQWCKSKKVNSE